MAEERKRNELEAAVLAFRDAEPEERAAMNAALTQTEAGIIDGLATEAAEAA
jgi:DNA-binding FadR family transcriptional regulator